MKKLLIVFFLALLSGCTSGVTTGIPLIVTGVWQGQLLSSTGSKSIQFSGNITFNIAQDGSAFAGTVNIIDPETNCWTGGTITGTISGNSFAIVITDANGTTITISGSLSNTVMTGIYVSTSTTTTTPAEEDAAEDIVGCPSHSGNFSVVKIG